MRNFSARLQNLAFLAAPKTSKADIDMSTKLTEVIERFKMPIALSLVGVVLILGGIFASSITTKKTFPKESMVEAERLISVDVSGAVQKPGVYQLKMGARIEEAISAAGGFTQTANGEYISKYLNMAQKLSDGAKVYVPVVGESGPVGQTTGSVSGINSSKVNINNATQAQLEALPGIGPVTASKIISDRPYQSIDDLLSKKIVSKAVFEKIKDSLTLY